MSRLFRSDVPSLRFGDRAEAGRRLAERLTHLRGASPIVLALPRGGVPVGYEVARVLRAPLDVLLVRKIGAPGHEEFGIGAVVDGVDGVDPQVVLDDVAVQELNVSDVYVDQEIRSQLREIDCRRERYLRGRSPVEVGNRAVIVVDDGIATGGTVRAALQSLSCRGVSHLVLAVPVAPADVVERLRTEVDELVCLTTPEPFFAVSESYDNFDQTSDEEVVGLLDAARAWVLTPATRSTEEVSMAGQRGSDEVSQGMDEAGSGQAPKLTQTTDRTKSADPHPEKQDQLSKGMSKAGTGRGSCGGKPGGKAA